MVNGYLAADLCPHPFSQWAPSRAPPEWHPCWSSWTSEVEIKDMLSMRKHYTGHCLLAPPLSFVTHRQKMERRGEGVTNPKNKHSCTHIRVRGGGGGGTLWVVILHKTWSLCAGHLF